MTEGWPWGSYLLKKPPLTRCVGAPLKWSLTNSHAPFLCKVPNTHVKLREIDNTSELNCGTWRIEIYRSINYNMLVR